jgi:hypothetical protein
MTLAIVRDYYAARTQRLVERLVKRRRVPGEDEEASVCIGGPANFDRRTFSGTTRVNWPNDEPPDEMPDEVPVHIAVWWEGHEIRVENAQDSEQFVDTFRLDKVRWRKPGGEEYEQDASPIWAKIEAGG